MKYHQSLPFIFSPNINSPASRIELNGGTRTVNETTKYVEGALVPKLPFSPVSSTFLNHQPEPIGKNFIGVIDVKDFVAPLTRLGIPQSSTLADLNEYTKTDIYVNFLIDAAANLPSSIRSDGVFQILGISFKEPLQITTTVDQNLNKHIGLHLDSWDRGALDQREKNRNRLCINMGEEARYLLFINKTIKEMLRDVLADPKRVGGSELGRLYLRKHPATPVTKITIQPGEAYIAPTENIIHDSTTLNKTKPDLALTFLGDFYIN